MNAYDSLPGAVTEVFGAEATAEHAYDLLTVDVPPGSWTASLEIARDKLGCTYFDWLSAVDEPGTGFRVCAHVVALEGHRVRRLLVRTTVPHEAPVLPSAVSVYAGAAWHERETHEMFGVTFTDHPHLVPLLLPEGFEGHPLRKDFILAARVAKAWPGAKEPGEPAAGAHAPKRRQMLPPGVPDPNDWGPLKGQLPPAPTRPTRTPRTAGAAGSERPPRRARTAAEGSAGQAGEAPGATPPRRTRSASQGSASRTPTAADAPWLHARPAFDEPAPESASTQPPAQPEPETKPQPQPEPEAKPQPQPESKTQPQPQPETKPRPETGPKPEADAKPDAGPEPEPEPPHDPARGPSPATTSEPTPQSPPTNPNAPAAPASPDGPEDEPANPAGGDPA